MICWRVQPSTRLRLDGKRHQSHAQGDPMPGKGREVADRKARAIVDDLRAAKTSTPRGSWRLRDRCVGEISALARLRNRSASGQAAAKARRTRLAVSMTRILYRSASSMVLRVNAKAPMIRAWPGARESSESLIFGLCERSIILSLIEKLVRHQAVERSALLGLDPLEWKGRQSLLQPLPHDGHDALQAPLRPEG
jgi:hypothetical protein